MFFMDVIHEVLEKLLLAILGKLTRERGNRGLRLTA
jgi:urease gamma subunit